MDQTRLAALGISVNLISAGRRHCRSMYSKTTLLTAIAFLMSSNAYGYECGGAMQWKFECQVTKIAVAPKIADRYEGLKRIDLDYCFDNRGGHHAETTTVMHVHSDSGESNSPLSWFDTVRFRGKETDNRITWIGSDYRRHPKSLRIEGTVRTELTLSKTNYVELIYERSELIGEIRSTCVYVQPY